MDRLRVRDDDDDDEPLTIFFTLLTHCQIMYWGSAVCYIHTIYITILVGLRPSKSLTSQLIFHNSNTGGKKSKGKGKGKRKGTKSGKGKGKRKGEWEKEVEGEGEVERK